MTEGTKRSEKTGAAGLKKQPIDFVSPRKSVKKTVAKTAQAVPVLSAKDAINARAKSTAKSEMPSISSAKELINSVVPRGNGHDSKSAANLHHSSLQKNLESTRTSASALLKMAKAPKAAAPPDLTAHADPLAKTAPIVAARLGAPAESPAAKPVVRTSLRLGSSARAAETPAVMPSNSRMVQMAKPVMSTDEELIQAFETSLQKPSSGYLLENAIQSAQGSPALEAGTSRSLANMVKAAHVGDLGRPVEIEANTRGATRKLGRKTSGSKLAISAKASPAAKDDVYDAASLDFIETSEIIESLKAEAEPKVSPKPAQKSTVSANSAVEVKKALAKPSKAVPTTQTVAAATSGARRQPRMSDITPVAQRSMKAAMQGTAAQAKIAKKTADAETIPVKLGTKAAISQVIGMPSAAVKVPTVIDNALKVNFVAPKKNNGAKNDRPLRFSEQVEVKKAKTAGMVAKSPSNGRRSLKDIFKGTREAIKKVQKGPTAGVKDDTAFGATPSKKPQPNHNAINIYASDFGKKQNDSNAISLGIVEDYGSELADRRANGALPAATYEPDRSDFATFEDYSRELGDVGLGAVQSKRQAKLGAGVQRNNFADATASYQDLAKTKPYDREGYVAESAAELGADARDREPARAATEAERLGKLVQAMDREEEDDDRAPGQGDLATQALERRKSGVAPAVRPSIDYYSADYYDPPKKADSAGGPRAENKLAPADSLQNNSSQNGREARPSAGMNNAAGRYGSASATASRGAGSYSAESEAAAGSVLASLDRAGGIEKDLEAAFAQATPTPALPAKPDNRYALGPDSPFLLKSANVEKRPLSDNTSISPARTINRGVTAKTTSAQPKKGHKKTAKTPKTHKQKPSPRDSGARPTVIVPSAHRSKTPLFCLIIFTIILGVVAGATLYLCFFQ